MHLYDRVRQLTRRRWPPLNYDDLNHQNIQIFPLQRCTANSVQNHHTNTNDHFCDLLFLFLHSLHPSSSPVIVKKRCKTGPAEIRPLSPIIHFREQKKKARTYTFPWLYWCTIAATTLSKKTATCPRSGIHFGEMSEPARERVNLRCVREIFRAR